jgi:hypothetical protein
MIRITKKELVDVISIPIMKLSSNVILYHKVKLSQPNKLGNRDYYHKEFTYQSRYKDTPKITTLRLSHSSILSIQFKDEIYSDSLILNITNRDFFCKYLKKINKVLKKDDLIIKIGDTYKINSNYVSTDIIEFYKDKFIIINPILVMNEEYSEPEIMIQLCLDYKNKTFIDIKEDRFKTMLKFIKKFDFHMAGLMAITYLQSSEIGKFEYEFSKSLLEDFDDYKEPEIRLDNDGSNTGIDKLKLQNPGFSRSKGW